MKVPRELIENVLVKVDEFYFLVNFIVFDIESTHNPTQILFILSHSFFATANTCINCRIDVMDISFGNKKARLNIFNATQETSKDVDCFAIDLIYLIQESEDESLPLPLI